MSGVAGIFYRDGRSVEAAELERMSARLAHRGADGSGAWQSGPAGLVHRLFWTTPESIHEQQPLITTRPDGVLVLTADARIDNRAELAPLLGLNDPALPDCAFILAAYEKWGEACPERLVGDFAFAIWDGPQQRLFCARDPLGVKNLFYFDSPRLFAFASEIKGLLCLPQVPRAASDAQIASYLTYTSTDPQQSFFESIRHVLPGQCLAVTATDLRARLYWTVDLDRELQLASNDDYAEAFREIFMEAVRCRLRGLTPPVSLLSGGLDSSSVTCMARHVLAGQSLHTISVVFDETPEADERRYMREVLAGGGLTHHEVRGDRMTPLFDADRMMWYTEEPFRNLGLCMQWLMIQGAQAQGLRQMLTGNGGDGIVSYGLSRLAELTGAGQWGLVRRELRDFAAAKGRDRIWQARIWWEFAGRPLVPNWARRVRRVMRRRWPPARGAGALVNPEFARRVQRSGALAGPQPQARTEREDHREGIRLTASTAGQFDRAAQAWRAEQRHPLLDQRLAEFCVALPSEQKFHEGQTRLILRRAMRGVLPEPIRNRDSKTTSALSLVRASLRYDRQRLDDCLLAETARLQPYVDVAKVQQAYGRVCAVSNPGLEVWPALVDLIKIALLSLWLRADFVAEP